MVSLGADMRDRFGQTVAEILVPKSKSRRSCWSLSFVQNFVGFFCNCDWAQRAQLHKELQELQVMHANFLATGIPHWLSSYDQLDKIASVPNQFPQKIQAVAAKCKAFWDTGVSLWCHLQIHLWCYMDPSKYTNVQGAFGPGMLGTLDSPQSCALTSHPKRRLLGHIAKSVSGQDPYLHSRH